MERSGKRSGKRRTYRRREPAVACADDERGELGGLVADRELHLEAGPILTGGDIDADWTGAYAGGDEAVGGSAPTPDQDVVNEIAAALGVERSDEEELWTSEDILRARDRFRWHLERDAADRAEGRCVHHRRGLV